MVIATAKKPVGERRDREKIQAKSEILKQRIHNIICTKKVNLYNIYNPSPVILFTGQVRLNVPVQKRSKSGLKKIKKQVR